MIRKIIVGCLVLISCKHSHVKKDQKSSANFPIKVDSLFNVKEFKITTDTFNLENFIPAYKNDSSYHKISSVQVRTGVQQIYYYSIYKMPKQMVLNNFNKPPKTVFLTKSNGKKQYCECKKIENQFFFKQLYEIDENNSISQHYFYKFKNLKAFEIYAYFSPSFMHQIIFDKNSDTVYHRVRDVIF